jgi:nesprin-1
MLVFFFQNFFEKVNERWIQDLVNSAQDLKNCLPHEQHHPVDAVVGRLQAKWKVEYWFLILQVTR